MKILVVEDEAKIATYLKKGLQEQGFVVDVAMDGEEGLFLALHSNYDLMILDVMLPKKDGWELISEIRKAGKQTLALFLSARDATEDRIKGLDLGADAYLAKPFQFAELMAQVRTLLRRTPARSENVLQAADLSIDLGRHQAIRSGKKLDLTPKEFALLRLLMQRKGEILTRSTISEQVWNIHFDTESNVVDVHIRRLRAKVDDPWDKKLIKTVRGIGYLLEETP